MTTTLAEAKAKRLRASAAIKLRQAVYRRKHVRYCIRYQWRRPGGCIPGADPTNWRNWREFGVVPILFHTEEEAQLYGDSVDIFKNMRHRRKVSASVSKVLI